MAYKNKTYIAAEWDGDHDAVEQLHKWNSSNYWNLSFHDAHELTQARDTSLNCSIKTSLKTRMDASKQFVLIVGNNTKSARAGSCQYCSANRGYCTRGHYLDGRSYIEYECEKAVDAGIQIVILYNSTSVDRNKCPDQVRYIGTHVPMKKWVGYSSDWDYPAVRRAIMGY